jgi:long-chain fatty acid transport protein
VVDFQWPAMTAWAPLAGHARLLLAADVKRIGWADVMKDFKLRYDSAGMGGSVSFALPQQWKDQTVTSLGLAYAVGPAHAARRLQPADNPIPDAYGQPAVPGHGQDALHLGRAGASRPPASSTLR